MRRLISALLLALFASAAQAETWRTDIYGYEAWRSDKGEVWKRDRYGHKAWRSNKGETCR
jgi:hypothetical protein